MSDFDPIDIRAQEQGEAERKLKAELIRLTEEADLKWLMADPRGRRFARRLLSWAGVWRLSFASDQATTAFNEGQRNIGLKLMDSINAISPSRLADVMAEEDYERTDADPE